MRSGMRVTAAFLALLLFLPNAMAAMQCVSMPPDNLTMCGDCPSARGSDKDGTCLEANQQESSCCQFSAPPADKNRDLTLRSPSIQCAQLLIVPSVPGVALFAHTVSIPEESPGILAARSSQASLCTFLI